jgi:hypothetical protein
MLLARAIAAQTHRHTKGMARAKSNKPNNFPISGHALSVIEHRSLWIVGFWEVWEL